MRSVAIAAVSLLLCLAVCAAAPVTEDPLSSTQLSEVIDAAITRLSGRAGWFHELRSKYAFHNSDAVFTCTPDEDKWKWPATDTAQGLWKRVLDSGELKVAGVKWSTAAVADYVSDPENPTGFWPEYLQEIVDEVNANYGTKIVVKRTYYDTSNLVNLAVADGTDDMSEPYYYISGFIGNDPRIEALHFSCTTVGTSGTFFTRMDSGITTVDGLYDAIKTGINRNFGFIGEGNYHSVSSILPDNTIPVYVTNGTEMELQVDAKMLVAGYNSEGSIDVLTYNVFPTGIIAPRVALFRKDTPSCESPQEVRIVESVNASQLADQIEESSERTSIQIEDAFAKSSEGDDDKYLIPVIVLACVALVLSLAMVFLVVKERKGQPVFSPLLQSE